MIETYDHTSTRETGLANIVISISEGELCACIGRTGSGKSNLIKLVAMRDGRSVTYVNGTAVTRSSRELHITYFPVTGNISGITVLDALLSARISTKRLFSSLTQLDRQIIDDWSDTFEISGFHLKSLDEISDGTYRTVMLARAFIRQTPLLVLDNPDDGLDPAGRMTLRRAMKKYLQNGERAIVFSTNDPMMAAQCADKIIVMNEGKAVASGTYDIITDDLMLNAFGVETIISKNVFNGRPEIQYVPKD